MTDFSASPTPSLPVMPDEALRLLGFCRRCGKVVIGASQVLATVSGKKMPVMVVIASDASERTKKQLRDKCSHRNIPTALSPRTGEELGHLLGKEGTVMAVGVTDAAMGKRMTLLTFGGDGAEACPKD